MRRLLHEISINRLVGGSLVCILLVLTLSLFLLGTTPSRAESLAAPAALPGTAAAPPLAAPAVRPGLATTTTLPAWLWSLLSDATPIPDDSAVSGDDLILTKSAKTADTGFGTDGDVVVNGEYITYTLTISNPSETLSATHILLIDILPEESLSDVGCSDNCGRVVKTKEIPDPWSGNLTVVTVTEQVSWTMDTLGPGEVQTRRLWGRVIGQADGTELLNRALISYVQGDTDKWMFSNEKRTTVRVPIDEEGHGSLSDAPNWLSEDLGGTLSMDWGDFDGDGDLDLALGSTIGTSIYRNQQGQLALFWKNERLTYGVAWGDFDGDGDLELAAVGDSLDENWWSEGRNYIYDVVGDSIVERPFTSPEQLVRVAPGDYDGDGLLDLVVSTNSINAQCPVKLYPNSGDPAEPFGNYNWICIAADATAALGPVDYDGDGDLDLAIGAFPNETRLLINGPSISPSPFAATWVLDQMSPFLPYDFAWGDYDGDGFLDLAVALPLDRRVKIYRNTNGSNLAFATEIPTSMFRTPLAVGWGDLNGDGRIDLVVADRPPRVYEYRDGKFVEIAALRADGASGQVWSLGIVDVDNEGDLDLAFTSRDGPSMLFSNFAPMLSPAMSPIAGTGSTAASSVAWADVNGDAYQDLLFGAGQTIIGAKRYLNVLGTFPSSDMVSLVYSGLGPHALAFGDVDGRGQQDIALGVGAGIPIQLYLDGNTDEPDWESSAPHYPTYGLAWGDADDDGDLDLLAGRYGPNALYVNKGTQLETAPHWTTSSANSRSVAWGDLDGDRYLDFAVGNYGQQNRVYRNNHDNTFSLVWTSSYISNTRSVAWGDYDGDGDLDLAVGNFGQRNLIYENVAGSLARTEAWRSSDAGKTTSLAWGDWDNDGDPDLAVGNEGQRDQVYANLNSRPGLPPRLYWLWASKESYNTSGVAWGDADGDGDLDLAASSKTSGQNGIYKNTYVTPSHLTNDFAGTMPLSNNPSYVAVERPGSTADAFFYSSAELLSGPEHPTVTVSYRLFDPDGTRIDGTNAPGDDIISTTLEFSLDGGSTWHDAMPGGSQVLPLETLRQGQSASFLWDAVADKAISDDARFKVCVVQQNQADPVQRALGCAISPPFRVRGTTCVWPEDASIAVSDLTPDPGDEVRFLGFVAQGTGILTYTWDFDDGTTDRGQVVYHTFSRDGTYRVKLTVRSEACPIAKELLAFQTVVVGTGVPNLYLPVVTRNASGLATSSGTAPNGEQARISAPAPEPSRGGGGPGSGRPRGETGLDRFARQLNRGEALPSREDVPDPTTEIAPGPGITLTGIEAGAAALDLLPITENTEGVNSYPSLSADGRYVAFWSTDDLTHSGSNDDGNIEIFVAEIYASGQVSPTQVELTQITDSSGNILGGFNLSPSISDNGGRIAFFSDCDLDTDTGNADANFEIFYADWMAGGSPVQLTHTTVGANVMPSVNGDGSLIAFASDRDLVPGGNGDYNQEIFVYHHDPVGGSGFLQVSRTEDPVLNSDPVISADGTHVAFISDGQLVMAELAAGSVVTRTVPSPSGGENRQPAISGDGSSVALISGGDVYLVELGGGEVITDRITSSPDALIDEPAISGDGKHVAFVSDGSLYLYNKDQQRLSQVEQASNARHPSLSANGKVLAFVSDREIYVTASPLADLDVAKIGEPFPMVPGRDITYTITVANLGPSDVVGATVSDTIPSDVKNPKWSCDATPGSACGAASGTGSIDESVDIQAGGSIVYIITGKLKPKTPAYITNTVVITPPLEPIDPRLDNNIAIAENPTQPEADLGVTKEVDDDHPNEGQEITYTLSVYNAGPSDAENTQLTDVLPAGVTFVGSDATMGSYSQASGLWAIGTLPLDTTATLTIIARVDDDSGGLTITNTATDLHSDADEPNPGNNESSVDILVNHNPDAVDDTAQTMEDKAVVIPVLANDDDLDGQLISSSLVTTSQSISGTLEVDTAEETITYTPEPDWHGTGSFEYQICDNDGACSTATVWITVLPVNDPPSFTVGPDQSVPEDSGPQTVATWATDVSVGAPYEEDQTLTFLVENDNEALFTTQPAVTWTSGSTATLTYESGANLHGTALVTVTLRDSGGTANGGQDTSAEQTFNITIESVEDAPVARQDSATTYTGGTVTVLDSGETSVLANDDDPDGDPIQVTTWNQPLHGSVTGHADGTFAYTHNGDAASSDSFSYVVCDPQPHQLCSTGVVLVTITPVSAMLEGPAWGQVGTRQISAATLTGVWSAMERPLVIHPWHPHRLTRGSSPGPWAD